MLVTDAKAIVRQWIATEASAIPGFHGAFYHGSAVSLPDSAVLAPTSDIDVMVVVDEPAPPLKLGKFRFRGLLFDVTWLRASEVGSAEQVLGNHSLAGSLRGPGIIADPTGQLEPIHQEVARHFADRHWVIQRCNSVEGRLQNALRSVEAGRPFYDQVTSWLFGTGLTTHLVLVAGLRNPTVRKRYLAARELLADYGHLELYDKLLEQLGCATIGAKRVSHHVDALADAFDAASEVIRTPVFFARDLSQAARPIAIDGSRELIAHGHHREAIFWIVATWARCQNVFAHDAPMQGERFEPGFRDLLSDLGITAFSDLRRRSDQVEASLPRVRAVADAIIAANREINGNV